MMRFRYIFDPLFIICLATYALNRLVLKPHFAWAFLHEHLNDLICIPFWVPIMLLLQRVLRLRDTGHLPPRLSEILIPLILWSWAFELWLPGTSFGQSWCTADPLDVVYYGLGALGAALFWRAWYGKFAVTVPAFEDASA